MPAGDIDARPAGLVPHDRPMLKTIVRVLLLRVLPRRIVPIVTLIEAALFLRGLRKRNRVRVNAPAESRTGPPHASSAEPRAQA
jgi:hypothetical protein